jgi:hypothetical protein
MSAPAAAPSTPAAPPTTTTAQAPQAAKQGKGFKKLFNKKS